MRILIATDAWHPQVNGVVRTLTEAARRLGQMGHDVTVLSPAEFRTVPCPTEGALGLAIDVWRVGPRIESIAPDALHVATQGPIGLATARYCVRRGLSFVSVYHTDFPQYLKTRLRVPTRATYAYLRWFHGAAAVTLVSTAELERELGRRGFTRLARWGRGVDTDLFRPRHKAFLPGPRPIFMYVGRVAPEKNLDAFLSLDLPGQKYVVGDGADLPRLRARYPDVRFVGARYGEELACHFAAADVFVFPSRTDTFGLVLLEALASGVPVAAYPLAGPRQSVVHGETGVLDEDLRRAALGALTLDPARCRASALRFSWAESIAQLAGYLEAHRVLARPERAASLRRAWPEPRFGSIEPEP